MEEKSCVIHSIPTSRNLMEDIQDTLMKPLKESLGFIKNLWPSSNVLDLIEQKPKGFPQTDFLSLWFDKVQKRVERLRSSSFVVDLRHVIQSNVWNSHTREGEKIQEIVCYGIGSITDECPSVSLNQLAILLLLAETLCIPPSQVYIYDPLFTKKDKNALQMLGFSLIEQNEFGRRKMKDGKKTLVFAPCVDIEITGNLLSTNWGYCLSNLIIFGNSITEICKMKEFNRRKQAVAQRCPEFKPYRTSDIYLQQVCPYLLELPISNPDNLEGLHELSLHLFPSDLLANAPSDLWHKKDSIPTT